MDKIKSLISKLKDYKKRFNELDVKEISDFLSIKNVILNKAGVLVNDSLLDKTEEEILNIIMTGFIEKKKKKDEEHKSISESIRMMKEEENKYLEEISKKIEEDIKEEDIKEEAEQVEREMINKSEDVVNYLESGVDDEYRNKIRSQIISKEQVSVIIKRGKVLKIQTNIAMNRIDIEIPSSFDIDIEQSLLLNLYDKIFGGKKDAEGPSNLYLDKELIDGIKIKNEDKTDIVDPLAQKLSESPKNTINENNQTQSTASSSIPQDVIGMVLKNKKENNEQTEKPKQKKRQSLEDKSGKLSETEKEYVKEKEKEIKENFDTIDNIEADLIYNLFKDLKDYYKVRNLLKKTYNVSYKEVGQVIVRKLKELNLSKEELINIGLKESTKTFKLITEE